MPHQKRWNGQVLPVQEKSIITVKEARKLLGKDAIDMSDMQVQGVINSLSKIVGYLLTNIKVPNNLMV